MKVDTSELLKGRTLEEVGGEEAPGLEEISYSLPEVQIGLEVFCFVPFLVLKKS